MTPQEFDACFDRFEVSARKLETQRGYLAPGETERIRAFEQGAARPVRSVRTEPWLARIAVSTAAGGKSWQRIRVLDTPLTAYQQYGMLGLVESQAAGEDVRIARRQDVPGLTQDFWLLDAWTPAAFAVLMSYDADGLYLGARVATDMGTLARCAADWELALSRSMTLNEDLANRGLATRVA